MSENKIQKSIKITFDVCLKNLSCLAHIADSISYCSPTIADKLITVFYNSEIPNPTLDTMWRILRRNVLKSTYIFAKNCILFVIYFTDNCIVR